MSLLKNLSESGLLSSTSSYQRFTARQVAEMVYLHVLALEILYSETLTNGFAKDYAKRSARYVGFAHYYQNATDLHLLIHALVAEDVDLRMPDASQKFKETLYFDSAQLIKWLRSLSQGHEQTGTTARILMTLDGQLQVKDSQMKAIRRLVQDWRNNDDRQRKLSMTRLLQIMRVRCSRSDLLGRLEGLARTLDLELKDVANPETGDDAPSADALHKSKKPGLLTRLAAMAAGGAAGYLGTRALMKEDDGGGDGGGATTAANIAPVVGQLTGTVSRKQAKTKDETNKKVGKSFWGSKS